jgi:RNA polymerase sigma-70 factor (ECF subfamily)
MVKPNAGQRGVPGAANREGDVTPLSLLERVRRRDPDAWHRLVQLYRPLVLAWCAQPGVNTTDAEDVAQEVFASAALALHHFRRDRPGDTFRGWLRVITRNAVLQHVRRNRGQPQAAGGSDAWRDFQELADPLPGPGQEDSAEISQLYLRALELVRGEFDEHNWRAFWLTVIEGRAPAALAGELNMTANHIRQVKSRVLRRLREEVGDLLD